MACNDLVAGCFGFNKAPFASHHNDAVRAVEYLLCCVKEQRTWNDVSAELRAYLEAGRSTDATPEADKLVEERLYQAQKLMQPWLEAIVEEGGNVVPLRL